MPAIEQAVLLIFIMVALLLTVEAAMAKSLLASAHDQDRADDSLDLSPRPGNVIAFDLFLRPTLIVFAISLLLLVVGAIQRQ